MDCHLIGLLDGAMFSNTAAATATPINNIIIEYNNET
jgi:hypothetical protein